MKRFLAFIFCGLTGAAFAQSALTVYNQDFAVVRDSLHLELKQGANDLRYVGAATLLEPDSVVLRDPKGKVTFQILEQSFRNDPVTQDYLLSLFEGKIIEFEKTTTEKGEPKTQIIRGKIVRSGYQPQVQTRSYRQPNYQASQPVIEVDGKMRFSLPGLPLFPSLGDDTILKPTLIWTIQSDRPARLDAELSYVTDGMSWKADYNAVAPEQGDTLDLVGWVTVDNQTGKTFEDAKIKLLAGDVSKVQPQQEQRVYGMKRAMAMDEAAAPAVTEKAFDEYHLYTLARPTTLYDHETKQVEFIRAAGIPSKPLYIYDGAKMDMYRGWDPQSIRMNQEYGTQSNPKVWVMREFYNSDTNHLGMPLPKGRMRFYRRDNDGQMEFTGENEIDHTAKNELIRLYTGNAFDLAGERKRSDYKQDQRAHWVDESFEIRVRNHKKTAAEIRVVEHLYRWNNWQITQKSDDFTKSDAQTIEFPVTLKPDEERTVTYTVHYSW